MVLLVLSQVTFLTFIKMSEVFAARGYLKDLFRAPDLVFLSLRVFDGFLLTLHPKELLPFLFLDRSVFTLGSESRVLLFNLFGLVLSMSLQL